METKPEFKVMAWKDYHGVETLFMVVDQSGYRCGVFASEQEAIVAAAKTAGTENAVVPVFATLRVHAPRKRGRPKGSKNKPKGGAS
jgi:hypothetical protein